MTPPPALPFFFLLLFFSHVRRCRLLVMTVWVPIIMSNDRTLHLGTDSLTRAQKIGTLLSGNYEVVSHNGLNTAA